MLINFAQSVSHWFEWQFFLSFPQERQPSTSGGPKHVHGQQQAHQQPGDQL